MDAKTRFYKFLSEYRLVYTTSLFLALLAATVLTVFSPSLHSDFVYDSAQEIVIWDFIHDPRNILTALSFRIMGMDVLDFNRPVAVTSLMFDSLLWGRNPFGYHLTNIVLHGMVACLVFLLIRHIMYLGGRRKSPTWQNIIAFLATLLFAVHPVVTEAVCEPCNRKDILAALFGLTALWLTTRHNPETGRADFLRLLLCPLLCLLAIGSKEVGVVFPPVLLLYWILFRRHEPLKFWAWILSSSFVVSGIFLIARFSLAHNPSEIFLAPPSYPGGSLATSLLTQPLILTQYAINIVWPADLCADYNDYSLRFLSLLPCLVFLIVALAAISWWSMKDRRVLFGTALFVLSLLPVCNLVPIYHPMADRFLYLPLIGIALLLALSMDLDCLLGKFDLQAAVSCFVLLLTACLIPLTLEREKVWSSELALWTDTLDRNPRSLSARVNLPEVLLLAGRVDEARQESEATLQTPYATLPWVWADYAVELNRLGDRIGAERAARQAIAIKPDIRDADKMVRTLQCPKNLATEFAQLAASFSNP